MRSLRLPPFAIAIAISLVISQFTPDTAAEEKPNIILILADDLGWADTTLYGHTRFYQTPNLERLAKRGMKFTRAYSNSPLCSPTRASLLTGQTPARHGSTAPQHHTAPARLRAAPPAKPAPPSARAVQPQSATRLDTALPTLGKLLKQNGYRTGHFGKWHLGPDPFSPLQQGFEVDIPHHPGPGPAGSFVAPWKFKSFKARKVGEHIEDRMADEAVVWIESVKDEPFFLNYWQFSVHAPFDAKPELIDHYRSKVDKDDPQRSPTYAAMVHSLDDAVGTLLDAVERAGVADRTVFIFISDNGGNMYNEIDGTTPTSNRPLRGGKATMYEGGIRVPCVVAWPGLTRPGSTSDEIIQTSDFYPTLLTQLGIPKPKGHPIDGIDISPALSGGKLPGRPIFTYFPHAPRVPDNLPPSVSIHRGHWKLIRLFHQGPEGSHIYRLYDLREDLGEHHDVSASHPELVKELDSLIEEHLRDAKTIVPVPNPRFVEPNTAVPVDGVINLEFALATARHLTAKATPDGGFALRTDGTDPHISLIPFAPASAADHRFLTFEYTASEAIGDLVVYYGPPINREQRFTAGALAKADSWSSFTIDLKSLSGDGWSPQFNRLRLDFGSRTGIDLQIRNLRLRKKDE